VTPPPRRLTLDYLATYTLLLVAIASVDQAAPPPSAALARRSAAVAEERNRLAREIHDSVAHYLTVANVQLEAAEKLGAERAQAALEHVRRARRLTLECLQHLRRSVACNGTESIV
jgi:signal transduction histidine kinase